MKGLNDIKYLHNFNLFCSKRKKFEGVFGISFLKETSSFLEKKLSFFFTCGQIKFHFVNLSFRVKQYGSTNKSDLVFKKF